MSCRGHIGDYTCPGWRARADAIRARDGQRCRCCNRDSEVIRLEVHHRLYGDPGPCGKCVLTGVADEDLVTLCAECHEAITNVRRAARYAERDIEIGLVGSPPAAKAPIRIKAEVTLEVMTATDGAEAVIEKETAPLVVRRRFDLYGKD